MSEFFYARPTHPHLSNLFTVGILAAIGVMVASRTAGVIALVAVAAVFNVHLFVENRMQHIAGTFAFGPETFTFSSQGKSRIIAYHAVSAIRREVYEQQKSTAGIGYGQRNAGQYRIALHGQKEIVLRVSCREEAARDKGLRRLHGIGALGIGLAQRQPPQDEDILHRPDTRLEREQPPDAYTLEAAIGELCARCALPLTDRTGF